MDGQVLINGFLGKWDMREPTTLSNQEEDPSDDFADGKKRVWFPSKLDFLDEVRRNHGCN